MTWGEIVRLAAFGLAGLVVGGSSLTMLRATTSMYVAGRVGRPIALHLTRLGLVGGALVWTALQGAGPLIVAAAGLTLARPIAVRLMGRIA